MRALVKESRGPGLQLREVPVPPVGPHDVLIKVHHAGVCGTDLHIWEWDAWAAARLRPPVIVGHEFAGTISALGPEAGATGLFRIGDGVTAEGHLVCGHCRPCRSGDSHVCTRTRIIGVDRDGAFAEYISMPASNVMLLATIPSEVGAIMDPLGNAFHTVLQSNLAGAAVLVVGCGPIGCFAVGVARAAGAALVMASDYNPRRLEIARAMGAHVTLDPGAEDVTGRVRELTQGEGADLVCEMSGHPDGHYQALAAVRAGGRVNLLGTPTQATTVDFARDVIFRGLTLYGVTGRRMYETWQQMFGLLRAGLLDPRPVITHRFGLAQIEEAIQVIKDGKAGKVILEVSA
jgi:threonine 3-dehydrogenase